MCICGLNLDPSLASLLSPVEQMSISHLGTSSDNPFLTAGTNTMATRQEIWNRKKVDWVSDRQESDAADRFGIGQPPTKHTGHLAVVSTVREPGRLLSIGRPAATQYSVWFLNLVGEETVVQQQFSLG